MRARFPDFLTVAVPIMPFRRIAPGGAAVIEMGPLVNAAAQESRALIESRADGAGLGAQMPFPEVASAVAGFLEEFGEGDFGFRQAPALPESLWPGFRVGRNACPLGVAPRQQGRAGRRTDGRGRTELGETRAALCESVEIGRV